MPIFNPKTEGCTCGGIRPHRPKHGRIIYRTTVGDGLSEVVIKSVSAIYIVMGNETFCNRRVTRFSNEHAHCMAYHRLGDALRMADKLNRQFDTLDFAAYRISTVREIPPSLLARMVKAAKAGIRKRRAAKPRTRKKRPPQYARID